MRNAGIWLAVAGLLVSVPGFAADPQVEAGRQCGQMKDSLQRLVCYDRIFQAGDSALSAPATPAVAPRAAAPAVNPCSAAHVAPPATVAAVAVPALGDESVKRKSKDEEKSDEPTALEATITALKETRPQLVRLTLDNGQVWQQMDMSNLFDVVVGDTVRIEKTKMGGFRLTRSSRGRSGWVRVTRQQ